MAVPLLVLLPPLFLSFLRFPLLLCSCYNTPAAVTPPAGAAGGASVVLIFPRSFVQRPMLRRLFR